MFEYKVKSGDDIITQGDDGDNFYVVESGLYNIYVNTANGNQLVGKCEDSGSFGELALMYNSKYLSYFTVSPEWFWPSRFLELWRHWFLGQDGS